VSCPNCGAGLTPMEMVAPSCRYCGKVLPSYAESQQKVMQVQAVMGGMVAGMMAPVPPQYGAPPYGSPPPYGAPPPYGSPPTMGGPMGAPPMMGGPAGIPAMFQVQQQIQRRFRTWILLSVLGPLILAMVIVVASALFSAR
jgi:uncharacterized protein (DUF983 family)